MKYKEKQPIIEALQYPGYPSSEIQSFIGDRLKSEQREGMAASGFYIENHDRVHHWLHKGDYVIKHISGDFSTCDPYIFEKIYEKVD